MLTLRRCRRLRRGRRLFPRLGRVSGGLLEALRFQFQPSCVGSAGRRGRRARLVFFLRARGESENAQGQTEKEEFVHKKKRERRLNCICVLARLPWRGNGKSSTAALQMREPLNPDLSLGVLVLYRGA